MKAKLVLILIGILMLLGIFMGAQCPNVPPSPTVTATTTTTATATATYVPTFTPTVTSTITPTFTPTMTPTITPTYTPTVTPTPAKVIVLEGDAAYTNKTDVSANIYRPSSDYVEMAFGANTFGSYGTNGPDYNDGNFVGYNSSYTVNLTSGDGPKRIYVVFKKSDGTVVQSSDNYDDIYLDTTYPNPVSAVAKTVTVSADQGNTAKQVTISFTDATGSTNRPAFDKNNIDDNLKLLTHSWLATNGSTTPDLISATWTDGLTLVIKAYNSATLDIGDSIEFLNNYITDILGNSIPNGGVTVEITGSW